MINLESSTILLLALFSAQPFLGVGQSTRNIDSAKVKQQNFSLERKWLEAEKQVIDSMYKNISAIRTDSIYLDSIKLEDANVEM